MWICENCGETFREKDMEPEVTKIFVDGQLVHEEEGYYCYCGGGIVPAEQCEACGEYYIEDDVTDGVCYKCFDKHCTYQNVMEMGIECQENYEINGFLASVFTPKEVEAILMVAFENMPEKERQNYIENYYDEDRWFVVSWLRENKKI